MHPPSSVAFFGTSEKSVRKREGLKCELTHTRGNLRACTRGTGETRYIKYILNLYSRRERLAAQPTLPSRRNTKFPYSDAPRQKLTLLRFIDPQYCVPPRGAPAVLVLRPRSNVHRFAPSRVRAYTQHSRVLTGALFPLAIVSVFPEVQGFDLTEYGYFYSVNVEHRDYRY